MKLLIIDGMNMFIRNFVKVPIADASGNQIGGTIGFMRSVSSLCSSWKPDKLVIAWDGEGGSRRRRGIFAEYKAGRKVRLNRPDELETQDESFKNMGWQLQLTHRLMGFLGAVQVEVEGVEADDVIAIICKYVHENDTKLVVSSDRDMLQLVDKDTVVYSPTKKVYWSTEEMIKEMKILPENYVYVKALMGDGSDNIPGVGGIGEKTALKMFPFISDRPTTASEILDHAEANKEGSSRYRSLLDNRERFLENVKLMQLSSPIIDPGSVHRIKIQLEASPNFNFAAFKLGVINGGIQITDPNFLVPFQQLHRLELGRR